MEKDEKRENDAKKRKMRKLFIDWCTSERRFHKDSNRKLLLNVSNHDKENKLAWKKKINKKMNLKIDLEEELNEETEGERERVKI